MNRIDYKEFTTHGTCPCELRAYHDHALIDEFHRRGIDTTAITGWNTISFAHPVRFDLPNNKLVVIN